MTFYYRYKESLYTESRLMLTCMTYPVIKETPKGVWIDDYGQKRFILSSARKRYASPTKEEALISFHARKRRQIRILEHSLARAKAALLLKEDNSYQYFGIDYIHG